MSRITYIYPSDGGEPYVLGSRPAPKTGEGKGHPTIMPDLPDFVSPIDGRTYSGRAGMREHNLRHDVVPNADLKGLPTLNVNSDTRRPEDVQRDKKDRLERIIREFTPHYR
jgi:hypothetical protein